MNKRTLRVQFPPPPPSLESRFDLFSKRLFTFSLLSNMQVWHVVAPGDGSARSLYCVKRQRASNTNPDIFQLRGWAKLL